jgi:dUTP pyrophosphatase
MASFPIYVANNLLEKYERVMVLKLFVDSNDELKSKYFEAVQIHNNKILNDPSHIDAGFDIFTPRNSDENLNDDNYRFYGPGKGEQLVNKLDFKICCSAEMFCDGYKRKCFNTGYYMYPRSSLSKTRLRLANSTGIIDAGYRGHIMGMFDVLDFDFMGKVFDRYVQICAPGLVPIIVQMVDSKEELGVQTERGDGGFGSTGV